MMDRGEAIGTRAGTLTVVLAKRLHPQRLKRIERAIIAAIDSNMVGLQEAPATAQAPA